jgi:hypothetical protein
LFSQLILLNFISLGCVREGKAGNQIDIKQIDHLLDRPSTGCHIDRDVSRARVLTLLP